MLKAVLFDLDNTLIDFMRMKHSSISAAIDAMIAAGVRLNKDEATRLLYSIYDEEGIEYQEIFQAFLQKAHRNIDYRILAHGIVAYRKVQPAFLQPYPRVIPTLLTLREHGLKLGIVTDAPRMRAWLRLVEMGIADFFDVVVCHEDSSKRKPHAAPFRRALSGLGVTATDALMVGDWPERDIKGAKKLGMPTVFAKYGASYRSVTTSGADYEMNAIEELPGIVAKVNHARRH